MLFSTQKMSKLFAAAFLFAVVTAAPANDFEWIGLAQDDSYDDPDNWDNSSPCSTDCYPASVSDNATFDYVGLASIKLIDEEIGDFTIQQTADCETGLSLHGVESATDIRELTVDSLTVYGAANSCNTVVRVTGYAKVQVR